MAKPHGIKIRHRKTRLIHWDEVFFQPPFIPFALGYIVLNRTSRGFQMSKSAMLVSDALVSEARDFYNRAPIAVLPYVMGRVQYPNRYIRLCRLAVSDVSAKGKESCYVGALAPVQQSRR